jgi:putative restriction endonuclease
MKLPQTPTGDRVAAATSGAWPYPARGWKDSTSAERLDPRNGLAACPAHDVAFDTGMLTVNDGMRIHFARPLADAIEVDPLDRQYYGRLPLRELILLPEGAQASARKYLDWHREKVFVT